MKDNHGDVIEVTISRGFDEEIVVLKVHDHTIPGRLKYALSDLSPDMARKVAKKLKKAAKEISK